MWQQLLSLGRSIRLVVIITRYEFCPAILYMYICMWPYDENGERLRGHTDGGGCGGVVFA